MSDKRKITKEIQAKLKDAIKSDGFLITLTTKKGDQLFHYHAYVDFLEPDILPSLQKIQEDLIHQVNPPLQITTTKAEA